MIYTEQAMKVVNLRNFILSTEFLQLFRKNMVSAKFRECGLIKLEYYTFSIYLHLFDVYYFKPRLHLPYD